MGKKKRSSGKSQGAKSDQGKSWLIMDQVKPPEPFNFQDSSSWSAWVKRYKMFHSAVGLATAGEDQQINMLLYCMGSEADDLLTSLGLSEENRTSFNSVLTTFQDYFLLEKNAIYHRGLFLERNQKPNENIDCYINELSKLAEKCDWSCKNCMSKDFMDEMILVKLINGIHDKSLSKHLLRHEISTLPDGVRMLRDEVEKKRKVAGVSKDFKTKESEEVENKNSGDGVSTFFKTMRIQNPNQVENNWQIVKEMRGTFSPKRESGWSAKKGNDTDVSRQISSIPSQYQGTAQKMKTCYSDWKSTSQEDKGDMRSSFSSGVDTGDECVSFSIDSDDLESDDGEYLRSFYSEKNYLPNKPSSSYWKQTLTLDDTWPELEKKYPKAETVPKPYDNFHFSVSGHQPRRLLRKICQQTVKNAY